jgi:CRP-like cAMP-binding protein
MARQIVQSEFRNRILRALPANEIKCLLPHLTAVRLVSGQILHEAGAPVLEVFFLERGCAAVRAQDPIQQNRIEVAFQGWEAMTGIPALLGPDAVSFNEVMVQMSGTGYRMSTAALRTCLEVAPHLRRRLFQSLEVFMAQVEQTAACNGQHALPERLARWLLMAHDRVDGDDLPITQDSLATMLAARRPSVTLALSALGTAGLIMRGRGNISIYQRENLESLACPCYARVQRFSAAVTTRSSRLRP